MIRREILSAICLGAVPLSGCTSGSSKKGNNYSVESLHIINTSTEELDVELSVYEGDELVSRSSYSIAAKEGSIAGSKKINDDWSDTSALRMVGEVKNAEIEPAKLTLKELGPGKHDIDLIAEESSIAFWFS